ncbi:MAG TPA: HAD hydrolase-like protein [Pyrinomonadaceae bacterium]|jgi:phosphoglycolate phosphatase-like HAD superfamily hydrolase|nr:HAD hydrolase-like protein [Pyrinomonadaceae bacterium]
MKTDHSENLNSSLILPPSSLRILLWDIDGTLIHSLRRGAFKDYTVPMLEEVFGTAGRLPEMIVSGMTDLQIVGEALKHEGFSNEDIFERIDHLRESYMTAMRRVTGNGEEFFQVLPGARAVLQGVHEHPRYRSALLTGNIEAAAYLKMELVGMSEFFDLPGAFGDESHDRRDLPALAHERIQKHLQMDLAPDQFIVIGDTPNDIDCARHFGARSLAVGTGQLYSHEDVRACKPDAFVPDFSDLNLVMEALASL